jgi:hypothetical protein
MQPDNQPGGIPRTAEERDLFLRAGAADFNPEPGTIQWRVKRTLGQFRRGILTEEEFVTHVIEQVQEGSS